MNIFPLKIADEKELYGMVERIGADPGCFPIFSSKRDILPLFATDLDTRAANALKQELLSRGGDVLVHRHSIDRGISRSDALIMATPKTLSLLLDKLHQMPYWGLDELRQDLESALGNCKKRKWEIPLRGGRSLCLDATPRLMGILNLTEDSFFQGSRIAGERQALDKAREMIDHGASIIDIGAESTRPGASPIGSETEISRLVPVIRLINREIPHAIISVDTYKSEVAEKALSAGAHMVNDIYGTGFDPAIARITAEHGASLVINHIQGTPLTMQKDPRYDNTLLEIAEYFQERVQHAIDSGLPPSAIILDPGIGFGKTLEDNLMILKHPEFFRSLGFPLMLGFSRKGFIGKICSRKDPGLRLEGTLALTALCTTREIQILRVHDVEENDSAIRMAKAVKEVLK